MAMNRREFLKTAAVGGGGLLLASQAGPSFAATPRPVPPEAVGILYDATLCIGCKACMVNCKKYNIEPGGALALKGRTTPPFEYPAGERTWDAPHDLSSRTLNIIKVYRSGTGLHKDAVTDGYSFLKQHCLHCLNPACASVCPVGDFRKDPVTGIVTYDGDKCIGCRYCMIACPFRIPRYEYEQTFPVVRKCQLCRHRIAQGKYAACCEYCPTGASIYGRVTDLRAEATRRLALKAGTQAEFPVQTVQGPGVQRSLVARYQNHVYGLTEVGGTQVLLLAGVPFDRLGFDPRLPDQFLPDLTWGYIAKIPALIIGVAVAGGLTASITKRMYAGKEGKRS